MHIIYKFNLKSRVLDLVVAGPNDCEGNMNKLTALLLCVFALALPCAAQTTGSINGVLTDASQAVVAEAELIVFNMDTGETRKAVASREGYFAVTDLQPGRYGIRVSMAGFKALVLQPLELTVGQHMTVNPVLQVGAVSESIEVSAAPPPVTTAFSSLSQTVDSQRIAQLPLNGRNALQLVALAPGVVQAGTAGQFGARQITFNVAGGRNIDMNFTLDGGQNMNSFWNIPVAYPNPDTLQEFVVTTRHYSATLGRGTSSVAAVSKSGTNEFHGTAYEFLRNTELDARSFFAANRSIFKRNQYGGSAGGPIARNKAFFLVGYQATKARGTPGESSYRTFTAEERAGNFSGQTKVVKDPDNGGIAFPGNIIPASRIRPFAKNFMQQFLPPANFGPDYYRYSLLDESNEDQLTARVDYSFSDKDKIYFRYFLNEVKQVGTNNAIDWDFVSDFPGRFQNFNFGYTRVFSPTLLNDLRLTHARNAASVINRKKFSLAALGMPVDLTNSPTEHGLTPQSVLAVSGQFTINLGAPTRDILPTTHFTDTLSWMHGKHQMTFGAEVYRNRVNEIQNWLTGGNISFDGSASGVSAADMLLGKFNSYRQISGFASRLRQTLPAFFVQDDIRATRRLTLNLGLRFEPIMGYVSENDLMMTFAPGKKSTMFPNAPTGLLYPGDADVPRSIFPTNWKTFAPRVGLAWDVFGDGRTSLRAGVGIFYVPLTRGISYNRFPLIQPFTADVTISGGDIDHLFDRAPFNGVSPYPRPDVSDLDQLKRMQFIPTANETAFMLPFKTQTDSQWSVSIQRAITRSGVLEAAYVGSSAAHLFTSLEANPAVYTPGTLHAGQHPVAAALSRHRLRQCRRQRAELELQRPAR